MSRVIVITGGTSGIGFGLKEMFEKNGDTVYTFSIEENESPNHYEGSVDHEIKVNQVFNDIHEKHGNIDMLINCAGFGMSAITEIADIEKIKNVIDVNFYGTLYCIRAALRYMKEGARIVNMSSAMALFPVPFRSIYGASKSAVLSLSMAMRMELAPAGIDVVAICPGDTKTNFTKNRIKEFETTERYGDRLKTATEHSDAKEDKRMTAEFVAEKIYNIINKPKTKPFYIIGGKYKFLYFLTKITPKSLLINITGKKLGGRMIENPPKQTKAPKIVEEQNEEAQIQDVTTFVSLNNEIADNHEETTTAPETSDVANETTIEQTSETTTTLTQEQAKNNISNMLSKITILNKPSEQKQAETTTPATEQVSTQPSVETQTTTVAAPQPAPQTTSAPVTQTTTTQPSATPVQPATAIVQTTTTVATQPTTSVQESQPATTVAQTTTPTQQSAPVTPVVENKQETAANQQTEQKTESTPVQTTENTIATQPAEQKAESTTTTPAQTTAQPEQNTTITASAPVATNITFDE